jgi:hypothetical protein
VGRVGNLLCGRATYVYGGVLVLILKFCGTNVQGEDKSVPFKKYVCCLQVNKNTCGFCLLDYYANKCNSKVSGFVDKNLELNINFFLAL